MAEYTADQVTGLLASAEWKMLKSKNTPGFGRCELQRFIKHGLAGVSEETWAQVIAAMCAVRTVAAPVVEGKAEAGTWHRAAVLRDRDSEGEQILVDVLFLKPTDAAIEFVGEDGCQFRETHTLYVDVTAIPAYSPAKGSGVNWDSTWQKDPDTGLFTGYTVKRETIYRTVPEFRAADDPFETTDVTKHLGLRTGDLTDTGAAVTVPSPAAAADGTSIEIDRQKNPDCTQDVTVAKKTAVNVKNAATSAEENAFEIRSETEDANESAAGTVSASQTAGEIATVSSQKTRFKNRWTVRRLVRACKAVTDSVKRVAKEVFQTTEELEHLHQDDTLAAPDPADGEALEHVSEKDEFLKVRQRIRKETAVNVKDAETVNEEDAFESRTEAQESAATAAGTVPDPAAGSVVQVASQKMRFKNRWIVRIVTWASKAVAKSSTRFSADAFEASAETEKRGQTDDLVAPTLAAGTVEERESMLDRFLRWTTRTRVTTAKAWTVTEFMADKTDDRVERKRYRAGNQASVPDATAGQRVDGSKNRFGLADFVRDSEAPITGLIGTTETFYLLGDIYTETAYTIWRRSTPIYPEGEGGRKLYYYRYPSAIGTYQAKYTYTITYHSTRALAQTEITGAYEGSRVEQICAGCYMATKVARTGVLLSTVTLPDPYEDVL